MLQKLWQNYPYRHFSRSIVWKDSNKPVPTQTPAASAPPSENTQTFNEPFVKMEIKPNKWEKWLLVYSKRYKSYEELPPRVSIETLKNAKSMVRIKIANIMIVITILSCLYVSWHGKRQAEKGDTLFKREMDKQEKIKAKYRAKKAAEAEAEANKV